ncbi:ABC transporter ATP-binding protein [Lactonifactor longoviformis]|uniref:ATP-binding cassette, subfamily B n=1 Tax=Lactonifactor longoviformis DSM 17459 TaxID=1122155 RepID=A0A1M4XXZ7_9CLOT|nr:ABC transporter ATP-binding protein [Lactonifactor longoviformis]POP34991.1 ABC transporter ATP-binding protein [Lactonifactor longoviformis]SHE98315.1 ATP-binding cassette, subfamily B [Lactonifactor longoviformis DSM 17459]
MIKLLRFLSPYKGRVRIMLVLMFLQMLGTLYVPTLTADIVNKGIINGNLKLVWGIGGFMLLIAVLIAGVSILQTYLSTSVFTGMGRDIRSALFKKSQSLTINEFNRFGPDSMITRCTNDITQIQQGYMAAIEMLLPAPIMAVAGLLLAFSKSPALALLIAAAMVVICILTVWIGSKAMKLFAGLQVMLDRINRVLRENLAGIRVIRAFNRSEFEQKRTDKTYEEYAFTAIRVNKIFAVLLPVIMVIMNVCTILIIALGGQNVANGQMEIGDIMALIEYAFLILMYLVMGIMVIMIFPRAQTCAGRVNEVLDLCSDRSGADTPDDCRAVVKAPKLEFCNVTFQYQGAEEPVLNNLSFTADIGKTTAIIGGTGSGKSTIASLIPRFYDIQSGEIRIDGENIASMSEENLRERIGFVPQKSFLFSGTILDNFRHGKKDVTLTEIRHAADIAQISDFIDSLDEGYETRVSQGGGNFSGGQKQRLSIARALVRKPEIYVFDDSFSALDFKTDAKLRMALKGEVKDAVAILVAQRISTIMDAEQIIVLDEGRVDGTGTHKELLANCAVYQQIAKSQLSEEELS